MMTLPAESARMAALRKHASAEQLVESHVNAYEYCRIITPAECQRALCLVCQKTSALPHACMAAYLHRKEKGCGNQGTIYSSAWKDLQ